MHRTLTRLVPLTAALLLAAACGGGGSSSTSPNLPAAGSSSGAAKGTITVASANFTENEIIADMYVDVLKKAGYTVQTKLKIGSRETYLKALQAGEVDVLPEYVGTLAQVLNQVQNGKDANTTNPVATGDPQKTIQNLQPLLAKDGLTVFGLSPAQDQNSYAVTKATASKYGLSTLSDLSKANGQLTFGGPPECQTRPQCIAGLKSVYGVSFKEFKTLDAGGPLTIQAIKDGTVDIGLVFSSDGAVAANDLVVLKDDKGLTPADNILTLAREKVVTPDLKATLTKVNEALTTEKLAQLNKQVGVDKADPAAVAEQFLKDAGLL